MKIVRSKFYYFHRTLPEKIVNSQKQIFEKSVCILELQFSDGSNSFGEISDFELQFFSSNELSRILNESSEFLCNKEISELNIFNFGENILYKGFAFAVENSLFNKFYKPNSQYFIRTKFAKLYNLEDNSKFYEKLSLLKNLNNFVIKLKIGVDKFDKELYILNEVDKVTEKNVKLRLDVNKAWQTDEAIEKINLLKHLNIDFIEQPVGGFFNLIKVKNAFHSNIQIAIDEDLNDSNFINELKYSKTNKNGNLNNFVLVIKPSLFGGEYTLLNLKDLVTNYEGKNRIIISSNFESYLGWSYLIYLTKFFPDEVHGITDGSFAKSHLADFYYRIVDNEIKVFSQNLLIKPYINRLSEIQYDSY